MIRTVFNLTVILALTACAAFASTAAHAQDRKEELRRILRENPELVLEVLRENRAQVLELVQRAARERSKQAWLNRVRREMKKPYKPSLPPDRVYDGPPNAPITIVAYSNFFCSHCAGGEKTARALVKKHPGEIRLLLKHVADDELSKKISFYFEAIGRQSQDKAWEFAEKVFSQQRQVKKEKEKLLQKIANDLEIDQKQLFEDMADPELANIVKADTAEHNKFGFHSTPLFLVNGVSITGAVPIQAFEEVIGMIKGKAREPKSDQ